MKQINDRITDVILHIAEWLPDYYQITDNTSFKIDLKFDSLALVHLQVAIEDEFDFRFDPISTNFITVFHNVKNLREYIKNVTDS